MRYLSIIFCAVLILFSFQPAQATIIHVPGDQSTIQAGINAASNGDTVLVAPGTYGEHINFYGKAILVTSEAEPESTVINKVSNNQPMVTFASGEGNNSVLDGFTIQNAYNTGGPFGGGIRCYSTSPTIRNNILKENRSRLGGGIYLINTEGAILKNNTLVDNRADQYGGGIYIEQTSAATLVNNIIVGSLSGCGIYSTTSSARLQYSDVWDNSPGDYCGTGPGTGCISADPVFCDPASDDYYLSIASPCVGAGQGGTDIGALGVGCDYLQITAGGDQGGSPYSQISVDFYAVNIADFTDTFDLDVSDQLGWNIEPTHYELVLDGGQVDTVDFTVLIPDVPIGTADTVCLKGSPQSHPSDSSSACLVVSCESCSLTIINICDVGNDQGKQVHIDWFILPSSDSVVTDFSIFRRKDSLLISAPDKSAIDAGLPLRYPPGEWEWLVTLPAFGETLYSAVVPTLKDSTVAQGMYWSVFFVRAGTDNPTLHFDSPIDSGYSLDNLSPSPPPGLFASHEPAVTKLAWSPTTALDFDYYTLYRDTLSGFIPDPSNRLDFTIDTSFVDSTAELGRTYYYLASATDFSGNESDPSNEAMGIRYITGDVTGDGVLDLGDVLYLISYLYKGGPAPDPLEAGDADNNGVVDLGDVLYLISYLYKGGPAPGPAPSGVLFNYDGCKEFQKGTPLDDTPPDQDCIEYQYDGTGVLLLKHINAGFNCCPDDLLADITIEDNIITIEENESLESGGCFCLCLFDVDYQISNLPLGEYTIRVYGMYLEEGDEILQFTVDLASSPSGIFCVYRDHYPWGIW